MRSASLNAALFGLGFAALALIARETYNPYIKPVLQEAGLFEVKPINGKYHFAGHPKIVDGDTIKLNGKSLRFAKIDTCENTQLAQTAIGEIDCGRWATEGLRTVIDGEKITCESNRLDRFKRYIVECIQTNIGDIGTSMLRRGFAFPYDEKRLPKTAKIALNNARQEGRGIWDFVSVEQPREWRKKHRRK